MYTGRNSPERRASTSSGSVRTVGLELGDGAGDVAGQVGVAAGDTQVPGGLAQLLGALVLLGLAAGVDPFDDGHVVEDFALLHVLDQADAEAARVGGDDVAAVVAGCP